LHATSGKSVNSEIHKDDEDNNYHLQRNEKLQVTCQKLKLVEVVVVLLGCL
jgi:hypothetical protein